MMESQVNKSKKGKYMPLQIDELTPYLSVIMLKIHDIPFDIDSLRTHLTSSTASFQTQNHNNGIIFYSHYTEIKKVNWTTSSELEDTTNHILIVYKFHDYLAIYHSDNSKKNKIYKLMFRSPLGHEFRKLKLIRKEVLNTAFLNGVKIKNLWLNSIDKSSEIKADSKMLSGSNLEEALDPIGDQMYSFSAIKVAHADFSIGVNSSDSKVWVKKFSDGIEFFDMLESLLDAIRTSDLMTQGLIYNPVSILANSHVDHTRLSNMIDIQLMNIEKFSNESEEYELLNNIYPFWDNLTFEFSRHNGTYIIDVFDSNLNQINRFGVIFSNNAGIVISNIIADTSYPDLLNMQQIFEHKDLIKFWFENDYTMIGGFIYNQKFRDVSFNGFIWSDFINHNVSKEKPDNNNFNIMGQAQEDSLFSWIKKYWTGINLQYFDFAQQNVDGWLLCDDGGNEKADFIHVTNEVIPTISLIHVKGANSNSANRQISTTAYEVVTSQALKNIRYVDKNSISETIDISPNANVANLVWYNGQQSSRQDFKNFLNTLPQYKKRVVILQPHVRQNNYNNAHPSATTKNRLNQLNALLLSAQNTIQSLGAEFIVIGAMQ